MPTHNDRVALMAEWIDRIGDFLSESPLTVGEMRCVVLSFATSVVASTVPTIEAAEAELDRVKAHMRESWMMEEWADNRAKLTPGVSLTTGEMVAALEPVRRRLGDTGLACGLRGAAALVPGVEVPLPPAEVCGLHTTEGTARLTVRRSAFVPSLPIGARECRVEHPHLHNCTGPAVGHE